MKSLPAIMVTRSFTKLLIALLGIVSAATLCADDHVDWVQVHADISYERMGPPSTTTQGNFSYQLQASLDQLLVRVEPNAGEKWPSYVLLDEYPRVGKLSGSIHFSGKATLEKYTASAELTGQLSALTAFWIDSVRPQSLLGPGLTAEIKVEAKLAGTVTSTLPGAGSEPRTAIFIWPSPIKYDDEAKSFITEGGLSARPPFGPRPSDPQIAMIYDMTKSASETNLPSLGGLVAPSVGAVITGNPNQWELNFEREIKTEALEPTNAYTHHVKIKIRLVPKTLATPQPTPEP